MTTVYVLQYKTQGKWQDWGYSTPYLKDIQERLTKARKQAKGKIKLRYISRISKD